MIQATQGRQPGQWWPVNDQGSLSAIYYCKNCGEPVNLLAYLIQDDGTVHPSVVCPRPIKNVVGEDLRTPTINCQKCSFHNYIRLVGWKKEIETTSGTSTM